MTNIALVFSLSSGQGGHADHGAGNVVYMDLSEAIRTLASQGRVRQQWLQGAAHGRSCRR